VGGSVFTALKNHYVSFASKASIADNGKTGGALKALVFTFQMLNLNS
jgi:hypothetical protein